MPALDDVLRFGTQKDVDDMIHAKAFLNAKHTRKNLLSNCLRIWHFVRVSKANVTGSAGWTTVGLTKVLDERPMSAKRRPAVTRHLFDLIATRCDDVFRGVRFSKACFGDLFECHHIANAVKQYAFGRQPIATGSTCFLLVMFDRLGNRGVNHKANVGPIDSHPECDGGHHNINRFA